MNTTVATPRVPRLPRRNVRVTAEMRAAYRARRAERQLMANKRRRILDADFRNELALVGAR